MREISFRCWDEKLKRWEYWGLPEDAGYMAGRFNKKNATKKGRRFSTKTLYQFTGLHDKNGKEIYEGDIFNFDYPMEVIWDMGSWAVKKREGSGLLYGYVHDGEVIGNVYENKELL